MKKFAVYLVYGIGTVWGLVAIISGCDWLLTEIRTVSNLAEALIYVTLAVLGVALIALLGSGVYIIAKMIEEDC